MDRPPVELATPGGFIVSQRLAAVASAPTVPARAPLTCTAFPSSSAIAVEEAGRRPLSPAL
eukprot:6634501-Pyramimonas_sp.AAC.1